MAIANYVPHMVGWSDPLGKFPLAIEATMMRTLIISILFMFIGLMLFAIYIFSTNGQKSLITFGKGRGIVSSENDYKKLRKTFDQAADLYQKARPDYPEQLFDDLIHAANLNPGDHLLEIGCASGKATFPLVRRGFSITCVELGTALASAHVEILSEWTWTLSRVTLRTAA